MPRTFQLPAVIVLIFAAAIPGEAGETPASENTPVASKPAEPMSPRMRAVLMAASQKFLTPIPAASLPTAGPIASGAGRGSDPAIVRLPEYLVRAPRLPMTSETLTREARAKLAMNQYLGSTEGLDRGFLNRFTIAQYWPKIPLLGLIPLQMGYLTNEERAMQRYREDERLRKMKELLEVGSNAINAGDRKLGEKIRRETIRAFRRD